jgi:uncharacterized protein YggT (Ycf19 family)
VPGIATVYGSINKFYAKKFAKSVDRLLSRCYNILVRLIKRLPPTGQGGYYVTVE